MKTIDNFNFKDKKALIRVDFNVPINKDFTVKDENRIELSIPTIKKILSDNGKVILISHMGNPNGIYSKQYSLKNIVSILSEKLNTNVKFYHKCIGQEVKNYINNNLKKQEVIILENLRFYKEEKTKNKFFAEKLYELGDIYVNEAFSCAHRAHTSNYTLPKLFKKKCFGYLFKKEVNNLSDFFLKKKKPITFILGGSKISTKINLITNILSKIDYLLIGGGMAFTFLKAKGYNVGSSIIEKKFLEKAKNIISKAIENNVKLYYPEDVVISNNKLSNDNNIKISSINNIPINYMGVDIGPNTVKKFNNIIKISKTIFWNGPMGIFEIPKFSIGTINIMKSIIDSTEKGAYSLIGGGDSIASVNKLNLKKISYISSGGGAMISILEGKKLPGILSMI